MKRTKGSIVAICGVAAGMAFNVSSYAGITMSSATVGSATDFPSASISGANGNLSFETVNPGAGAGGTIAGAQVQGGYDGAVGWGETFNWAGSANGNVLSAYSMIITGANPSDTYQPFLLDLGTSIFNGYSTPFNPSLHPNLLSSATTFNMPNVGGSTFLEFDLTGSDAITLTVGHSYAFGLLNGGSNLGADIYFLRAGGVITDPNGMPFYTGPAGLSDTSASCSGWGGSARNIFVGLYTTPVPEPSSLALVGAGIMLMGMFRRSKAK